MIYKTLSEKCNYYRDLTDYRLLPNSPILVMIDGKNFSKLVKNKFKRPFDDWFIKTMNKTAEHVCSQIQNCVGAYVQSDEISFLIKDSYLTDPPYDGRLCKLQSVIPAIATSFFTKEIIKYLILDKHKYTEIVCNAAKDLIDDLPDYCFDCKVWTVPNSDNYNDVIAWFLYRQIDCVRNSKQQFCQTYLPHKQLTGLHTDEQVKKCIEETGQDWNGISEDKKYGRFLYKDKITKTNERGEEYFRRVWEIWIGDLTDENNRLELINKWLKEEET